MYASFKSSRLRCSLFLKFPSFLFRSRYPINKPERRVVGDKESHLVPLDEGLVDDVVRLPQVEQESDIQAPTLLGNLLIGRDIVYGLPLC